MRQTNHNDLPECWHCSGAGSFALPESGTRACPTCRGTGYAIALPVVEKDIES